MATNRKKTADVMGEVKIDVGALNVPRTYACFTCLI